MLKSQFLQLFKSALIKYKVTYFDPCTNQCVPGACDQGGTGTETVTTITNTLVGHKIGDYTNEAGTVTSINETITNISGNSYINENGASQPIIQSVVASYSPTGDVLVTVNGVVSNALPVPKWTKEIKDITTINTIPNFLQTPLWKSVTIIHDTATLTEGIHYTISGTTITFNPIAYGKDINVGELVELHYQYI